MPSISIWCSPKFYPIEESLNQQLETSPSQFVGRFAQDLPQLIMDSSKHLPLYRGLATKDFQVVVQKLHVVSKNTPDIWITVQFTQVPPLLDVRENARDQIAELIEQWLERSGVNLKWKLDIFYWPGNGAISNNLGKTVTFW